MLEGVINAMEKIEVEPGKHYSEHRKFNNKPR